MSQVIIKKDSLESNRQVSATQELKISTAPKFERALSSATQKDPFTLVVGIAAVPVWLVWSVMAVIIYGASLLLRSLMLILGKLVR